MKRTILITIIALIAAFLGYQLHPVLQGTPAEQVVEIATAPVDTSGIKEVIITDLEGAVASLDSANDENKALAEKLARMLRRAKDSLAAKEQELARLTTIFAQMEAKSEAAGRPVETTPGDVTILIPFEDSLGWFSANVAYSITEGSAKLDLKTRDEYAITEWEEGGRWKVQIDNLNPYSTVQEGSNVFVLNTWQPYSPPGEWMPPCNIWTLIGRIFEKKDKHF